MIRDPEEASIIDPWDTRYPTGSPLHEVACSLYAAWVWHDADPVSSRRLWNHMQNYVQYLTRSGSALEST